MDRGIVYPGAIPQDTDILGLYRRTMIAIGYVLQAAIGTGTVVDGLICTPTSPASLVVNVSQGSIIALEEIDLNVYGSLSADNNPLVKIGINAEGLTPFTITVPVTSGYSQNYLIEATFNEVDNTPIVLPYYNAANPSQPYSGPNNSGASQNTVRAQIVELQLKAGAAAATGTQTTPAVDIGYVGLYVITVNYGQSTITAGNIFPHPASPFILTKIPQLRERLQANLTLYVNAINGNDSNNGLSAQGALLTLQGAWNIIKNDMDLNGYTVTVSCSGAFGTGVSCDGPVTGADSTGPSVIFDGGSSATVVTSSGNCFSAYNSAFVLVRNFSTLSATSIVGSAFYASNAASLYFSNVTFGTCGYAHITGASAAVLAGNTNYTITGNAPSHLFAGPGSNINTSNITVTLTGTPAFSGAYATATQLGYIIAPGMTFTGSATGIRYNANLNAVIYTANAGASYFPGSIAGVTTSGGQYD